MVFKRAILLLGLSSMAWAGQPEGQKAFIKELPAASIAQIRSTIDKRTDDVMKTKQLTNKSAAEVKLMRAQVKLDVVLGHIQTYVDGNLTIPKFLLDDREALETEIEQTTKKTLTSTKPY